jgi:uncharacterized protein
MFSNIAVNAVASPQSLESSVLIIFIAIGLGAGVLSGLFGIGGGVVIVPALIYFARLAPIAATGTSLGALLLPVGAFGAWEYYRNGNLNIKASLWISLGLFVGVFLGAKLAHHLSPLALKRSFSVFLALVSIKLWFG